MRKSVKEELLKAFKTEVEASMAELAVKFNLPESTVRAWVIESKKQEDKR